MQSLNITLPDAIAHVKQGLSLTPAPKGSGFKDTSENHDKILAEQAFSELPV
jgi:hypothetical protein